MAEPKSAILRANRLVGEFLQRAHKDASELKLALGTPITVTVEYGNGSRYQSLTLGGPDV